MLKNLFINVIISSIVFNTILILKIWIETKLIKTSNIWYVNPIQILRV